MTHHVVIVGAGFGGLAVAHGLAGAGVRITIIDQRNHHLFQPLLYQVGTAVLATSEIAWPIRHLVRKRKEVTTLLGEVTGVDTQNRRVLLGDGGISDYDTLVLATGARHAYFGHDEWEPYAPGLKTLEDATAIRRRILLSFERAEREVDPTLRAALLTFVIVGGGPTGVELAGAIVELHRVVPAGPREVVLPFPIGGITETASVTQQVLSRHPEIDVQGIRMAGAEAESRVAQNRARIPGPEHGVASIVEHC